MTARIYQIDFEGSDGTGRALLVLLDGQIVGADLRGGRYVGTYEINPETQTIASDLTVTVPEGATSVTGQPVGPGGLTARFHTEIDAAAEEQRVKSRSEDGHELVSVIRRMHVLERKE